MSRTGAPSWTGPESLVDRAPRDREIVALRLAGPKRAGPGRVVAAQADAGHLPLFIAADEPRLF